MKMKNVKKFCIKPLRSDLIYEGIFFCEKTKKTLKNIYKIPMLSELRICANITNLKKF